MALTLDVIKAHLSYDPTTQTIRWNKKTAPRANRITVGAEFGRLDSSSGYKSGVLLNHKLYHHRLVWMFHHGLIPDSLMIDHIDHNKSNNSITNLRLVSSTDNARNKKPNSKNTTGVAGVYKHGKSYVAEIRWKHQKKLYLGSFSTLAEAADARAKAEMEHGFHPNHGRVIH
jgi:hypothetical protein